MSLSATDNSLGPLIIPNHRRVPAWVLSLVLHAILFAVFLFAFRVVKKGGPAETGRPVGLALVKQSELRREYTLSDQPTEVSDSTASSDPSISAVLPKAVDASIDLTGVLPSVDDALFGAGDIGVGETTTDLRGARKVNPGMMGKTTTSVFGVSGTGSTFVYVFDRSASMKGRPLAAAKQQLIQSLRGLEDVHQFHVIFYNENPKDFKFHGRAGGLVFANEQGKSAGISFVQGISAVGGTRHMPAITNAIGMRPDVVFFLTDADEPQLTELELRRIRRLNNGTTINAIQFGLGPQSNSNNFLVRLAQQNGGQHAYVDVTLLRGR